MRVWLLFLVSLFCLQTFATDITVQRKNFLYAESALQKGDLTTYYRLKKELTDYPLYPYLQYAEIMRMMRNSLPADHVKKFIDTYPQSSLAMRLQANWLQTLAKQQQWALFRKFYTLSDDVALQCYAIWAEYKTTQKSTVLAKATPLWVKGYSQPDACNPLFSAWQKSSYFNNAQAWKRTQLAMKANQTTLVNYLRQYLTPAQLKQVDDWVKLNQFKSLIKQDTDKALRLVTPQQRDQVAYAFAIELATDHHPDAITWLNAVPKAQMDTPIYEWRVRYALRKQDWNAALQYIMQMPAVLQLEPTWRYWQGRAYLALNQTEKANTVLKPLASERHYHGMLASDLLNQPYSLNNAPYQVSSEIKTNVANNSGIKRATELFALKRLVDARREWMVTTAKFKEKELQAAALLARSLNWYDRGIFTGTQAVDRNDLHVRFPLAYEQLIKNNAHKNKIDVAWVFAISRQESAFIPDAQSHAGATGIMQLMPATAQLVAKQIGQPYNKSQLVLPEKNIPLGTTYLRDMLVRFEYNRQPATAAYNAGASRALRWLPEKPMPLDIWIETIPFKETRNYVQNVNSFWVIYNDQLKIAGKRLNQHSTLISR